MKAVTANRLIDGEVVFWKAGAWVEGFGDAELFDESREAEVEAVVAKGKAQATTIVDPYPIDLAPVDGGLAPRLPRTHPGPGSDQRTHPRQAGRRRRGDLKPLPPRGGRARSTGRVDLIRRK